MRKPCATTVLLVAFCHPVAAADGNDPQAVADTGAIVTAFQAALLAKDRSAPEALPADNSWLSAASDAKPRQSGPRVQASDYRKFAQFIATSKEQVEERYYHVRIFSNGSIGAA